VRYWDLWVFLCSFFRQYFDTVGWVFWPSPNNLYCVGGDMKHYTTNQRLRHRRLQWDRGMMGPSGAAMLTTVGTQHNCNKSINKSCKHDVNFLNSICMINYTVYQPGYLTGPAPVWLYRRLRGDAIETYKYLHGQYRTNYLSLLPMFDPQSGVSTRGHSSKLQKETVNLCCVLKFRIVNFWNSLPEDVVSAESVNCFKNRFDCHCQHLHYSANCEDFKSWGDQSTGYF